MSREEQDLVYMSLKARLRELQREKAAIESDLKGAAPYFSGLSRSLKELSVGNWDWTALRKYEGELPAKAQRYEELKLELAEVQAQIDKFPDAD
jgi:hypothetical protein